MVDYYTHFSFCIEAKPVVLNRIAELIEDTEGKEDEEQCFGVLIDIENDGTAWIRDEDGSANLDLLLDILARVQKEAGIADKIWALEWSNTCSKPRTDAYGGGAAVIYNGRIKWTNTDRWIAKEEQRIQKREAKKSG
jgi:hypothetical protein